jgi:hypothetical protein
MAEIMDATDWQKHTSGAWSTFRGKVGRRSSPRRTGPEGACTGSPNRGPPRVRVTLAALKRKHAELLALHASDLSYREIADAMRLNPASALC